MSTRQSNCSILERYRCTQPLLSVKLSTHKKNSTIAKMAAQCCAIRFFAVELGVPLFNAVFPSKLSEYSHKSYIAEKQILWAIRFCCIQYRCNFNHYDIIGPCKVMEFGEIMQKNGDYVVRDISRITIWYQWKAYM